MKRIKKYHLLAVVSFIIICFAPFKANAGENDISSSSKIYNVLQYGADNSGKTSSDAGVTEALTAARNDIRRNQLDGKKDAVIYFPNGTYKLSTSIRLYEKMTIVAQKNAVINFSGTQGIIMYTIPSCSITGGTWRGNSKTVVIGGTRVDNITIKDLKITGGRTGIQFYSSKVTVKNVSVTNCKSMGMNFSKKTTATVTNCKVNKNGSGYPKKGYTGHGISVFDNSTVKVSDTQLNDNRECGLAVNTGKITMNNCHMYRNGRHGLDTSNKCNVYLKDCDIYKNGFLDNLDGMILKHGSTGKIINCKFRSNAASGLLINHGNTNAYIKGCTFTGNVQHNIYSENLQTGTVKMTVENCKFYKCKKSYSFMVNVSRKSGYKLKLKGNKHNSLTPRYVYVVNGKWTFVK